jgi:diguanylate cyclase (GGDEF)-like protein
VLAEHGRTLLAQMPAPSMLSAPLDASQTRLTEAPSVAGLEPVLAGLLPVLLQHQGHLLCIKEAATGRFVHVNAGMAAFLQKPASALVGVTDGDLFDSSIATALRSADLSVQGSAEPAISDHRFEWAGLRREFSVLRLLVESGTQTLLCCVWHDRGAERLKEAQLRIALEQLELEQRANDALRREIKDQGLRDAQVGLYTRAHFEDQLRREIDLSVREHREFALVLVDIDPWSETVRQNGPEAQLRVVKSLGQLLRSNTRAMDASCHLDGSRFAVLLSGVGLATAHGRMEQLRRQCATQIVMHESRELHFTVSIGVASFPHTAHSKDELLLACEHAVAQARTRGNHVSLASIRLED